MAKLSSYEVRTLNEISQRATEIKKAKEELTDMVQKFNTPTRPYAKQMLKLAIGSAENDKPFTFYEGDIV